MTRRLGDFDAKPYNILASVLGHPPRPRPTSELSPGLPYHGHHLGFDYRALERMLKKQFRLQKKWFSPLPVMGAALNSEVYFLLSKD